MVTISLNRYHHYLHHWLVKKLNTNHWLVINNHNHPPTNYNHPPTKHNHPPTNHNHLPTNYNHPPTNHNHPTTNNNHSPTNHIHYFPSNHNHSSINHIHASPQTLPLGSGVVGDKLESEVGESDVCSAWEAEDRQQSFQLHKGSVCLGGEVSVCGVEIVMFLWYFKDSFLFLCLVAVFEIFFNFCIMMFDICQRVLTS